MLLTAALVSSCGNGATAGHDAAAAGSPSIASASTAPTAPTEAPIPTADIRPCVNVQAILSHITTDTAQWSPTRNPFDDAIATRLGVQASYMNQQAMTGDYALRRAVAATAKAFEQVSRGIAARSQKKLDKAVKQSQVAYAGLKKLCHYSTDG